MNENLEELWIRSNEFLLYSHNWEEIVSVSTKFISLETNQKKRIIAYYSRGNAKYELGDYEAAVADFDKAIQLESDYDVAYYKRGNAKYELGDYKDAIADYDKAIQLAGNYVIAYHKRGNAKYELGDYKDAVADYDKAIQLNPNYDVVYYSRGKVKYESGDYKAAVTDYSKAIQINHDYAVAYYSRGNIKYELENYKAAIADYDKAIQFNLDDDNKVIAYYNRGNAKYELGDYKDAIADYNNTIQIKPDYATAYIGRGNAKYKLDNYTAAIADYDKAIQFNLDDDNKAITYHNRGKAKYELGDYKAAIADYNKAIQIKPDYTTAYIGRGNAKYGLGDYSAAIADYNKAIRFNSDDDKAVIYYNRGNAKYRLGDYSAAILDYNKAIRFNPDLAIVYYSLGVAYCNLKSPKYKKAFDNFVKADQKDKVQKTLFPSVYITHRLCNIIQEKEKQSEIFPFYYKLIEKITDVRKKQFHSPTEEVSHYTSLNTLKLLADNKRFRFYNTAYMSDLEEGRTFFEIMRDKEIDVEKLFYLYNPHPSPAYIGSWVMVTSRSREQKDELFLWRIYGKQDNEEAAGACLIFKPECFARSIPEQFGRMQQIRATENPAKTVEPNTPQQSVSMEKAQDKNEESKNQGIVDTLPALYKVAYISGREDEDSDKDLQESLESLAGFLKEIDKLIQDNKWKSKENALDLRALVCELLDNIRFLFKSAHYREEHEVRVIDTHYYTESSRVNPDNRLKQDDQDEFPQRFYLEAPESMRFSEVILGPETRNSARWEFWLKVQKPGLDVRRSQIKYRSNT